MTDVIPLPEFDWITQRELAGILGVSEKTASVWAKAGRLEIFAHGLNVCGRRRYSRSLLKNAIQCRRSAALERLSNEAASPQDAH